MSGKLIVSLDFELFWGMQDHVSLDTYGDNIIGARPAVASMLELFEKHGIHATWATVGMLFAENVAEAEKYFPEKGLRPSYKNDALSSYRHIEESAVLDERYYFAPELIRLVSKQPGQEIGSHTFAHYYCREEGQTQEQFAADIKAAIQLAEDKGYKLTSAILPRNQCTPECVEVLREHGFTAYRDEENDWIHEKIKIRPLMRLLRLADVYIPLTGKGGYIPKNEDGIINLVGSRMYKPIFRKLKIMEGLKIRRIKKQMHNAAKQNLTFHLWWHPHNIGIMTEEHLAQLEEIFSYYDELKEKYGMRSLNMREAAEEIRNA